MDLHAYDRRDPRPGARCLQGAAARLRRDRFSRALGPLGGAAAERPRRHVGDDIRFQSPGSALRGQAGRPAARRQCLHHFQAAPRRQGSEPAATAPPSLRCSRRGHHGRHQQPRRPVAGLHVAGVSAVRRDVRRRLCLRRSAPRIARGWQRFSMGPHRPSEDRVRLARDPVQCRRVLLSTLHGWTCHPRRAGGSLGGKKSRNRQPGRRPGQHAAANARAAARGARTRERIHHARRDEQRQREPLLRRADGRHPADERAGSRRRADAGARRGNRAVEAGRDGRHAAFVCRSTTGRRRFPAASASDRGFVQSGGRGRTSSGPGDEDRSQTRARPSPDPRPNPAKAGRYITTSSCSARRRPSDRRSRTAYRPGCAPACPGCCNRSTRGGQAPDRRRGPVRPSESS